MAKEKTTKKKAIVTPQGGKVETKQRMGAPVKELKNKQFSAGVREDYYEELTAFFGDSTPAPFVRDFLTTISEDKAKFIEAMALVYGEKSRNHKLAKVEFE
jgi:hypothetical protein